MRGYFGLGQLSASEKQDILNQHKSLYNGYQTMQPQVSNTQPLYVYDAAGDKDGFVVNNRGEVKKYTNMGINESAGEVDEFFYFDEDGEEVDNKRENDLDLVVSLLGNKKKPYLDDDDTTDVNPWGESDWNKPERDLNEGEPKEVCDECGAMIMDGMCECNYGHMDEGMGETCEQCGGSMSEGMCNECGSGYMEEETGHLDDIYDEEDLNPSAGFDYIEGSSNNVDTFEKMHKNLYEDTDYNDYESSYTDDGVEDPDNEDDGFQDINTSEISDGELDELGTHELVKGKKYKYNHPLYPDEFEFGDEHKYETGNNMYSFRSGEKGYAIPGKHVEDYVSNLDDEELFEYDVDDMDVSDVEPAYDFESNGPGDVYPVNEDDMYGYDPEKMYEFDEMKSAWADEELEEQPDISGVQGIYGDMERAYDFDSDGPGKGGPYQEFSYESELDEDEEFTSTEDDFEEVDEDLKESFLIQKNKITEMFNRFNRYN